MTLSVIIPVKSLDVAKSRLSSVLTPADRAELAEVMLRQVLRVVAQVRGIDRIVIITRDVAVLAIGRAVGVDTLRESASSDLNRALTAATRAVMQQGAKATLILPADIPFITTLDVQHLIQLGDADNTVVIAPDDQRSGTNALLVRPAGLFAYAYGHDSFNAHIKLAQQRGAVVHNVESETLALDIDLPDDLYQYNERVLSDLYAPDLRPFLPFSTHA